MECLRIGGGLHNHVEQKIALKWVKLAKMFYFF